MSKIRGGGQGLFWKMSKRKQLFFRKASIAVNSRWFRGGKQWVGGNIQGEVLETAGFPAIVYVSISMTFT